MVCCLRFDVLLDLVRVINYMYGIVLYSSTMNSIRSMCHRESHISSVSRYSAVCTVRHLGTLLIISLLFILSARFSSHPRSTNRQQLIIPHCRLNTYGRRAFSIACPTVCNSLADELRDPACDSDGCKQFLKTILFSLY